MPPVREPLPDSVAARSQTEGTRRFGHQPDAGCGDEQDRADDLEDVIGREHHALRLHHVVERLQRLLRALAQASEASSTAEAPSVIGVEFPAVKVPALVKSNAGRNLASFSSVVSVRILLSWESPR